MSSPESMKALRQFYVALHQLHGVHAEALGCTKGKQTLRYAKLLAGAKLEGASILDVGCGFGDLFGFLRTSGLTNFRYVGIDAVPEFVAEAQRRFTDPRASFLQMEFPATFDGPRFDIVVASGAFSLNTGQSYGQSLAFVEDALNAMLNLSKEYACADFITNQVDFRRDHLVYYRPQDLLGIAQKLTRRFVVEQDVFPFEYLVKLYKNDAYEAETTVFTHALPGGGGV